MGIAEEIRSFSLNIVLDKYDFQGYCKNMIPRTPHENSLLGLLRQFPVVALLGARQVGKTTLARLIADQATRPVHTFDLEDPTDLARLDDPKLALAPLQGLVVLDEAQRLPELFPLLRVLADRPDTPAQFLVLGSASPSLNRQSGESLAGRIAFHDLPGLMLSEVGDSARDRLWVRGGFPRAYLADDDSQSELWRRNFIRTYLERDLSQLGFNIPAENLRRLWTMLAHSQGQVLNISRLAGAMGMSTTAIRHYLGVLVDTFMVRLLPPFLPNIGKRLVKSPKIYLRDSGLLHTLLGLGNFEQITAHPVVGASWEGFAMEQVIQQVGADPRECHFWATHAGAELDLLITQGGRRIGYEFKRTSGPRTTKSMHSALESLGLDELRVVYPGERLYPMAEKIVAMPLEKIGHST
jgi:hypothetical protein